MNLNMSQQSVVVPEKVNSQQVQGNDNSPLFDACETVFGHSV